MSSDPDLVRAMLESVQLGQYCSALLNAGYDSLEKTSHLTEHILEYNLGISLPGHRRRLLQAMKQCDQPGRSQSGSSYNHDAIYDNGEETKEEEEEEEEEGEVYDLPPQPRSIAPPPVISRTQPDIPDYMNFRELEIIPAPMLPPKKNKHYPDDDLEKFGMGQSPEVSVDQPVLNIPVAMKRPPVAKPRQSMQLEEKPPQLPPRVVSSSSISSNVILNIAKNPAGRQTVTGGNGLNKNKQNNATPDPRFCDDLISFDPISKSTNWTMYGNTANNVGNNYDILSNVAPVEVYDKLPLDVAVPSVLRAPVPTVRQAPPTPIREVVASNISNMYCPNSARLAAEDSYEGDRYEDITRDDVEEDDLIYEGESPLREAPEHVITASRPAPPPPRRAQQLKNQNKVGVPNLSYELMNNKHPSAKSDVAPTNVAPRAVAREKPQTKGSFLPKGFALSAGTQFTKAKEFLMPAAASTPTVLRRSENSNLVRCGQNTEGDIIYEDCDTSEPSNQYLELNNQYLEPDTWVPGSVTSSVMAGPKPPQRNVRKQHDMEDGIV